MRILHLMLSCFYIDGANYQENIIPLMNKREGHDVKIIASTEVFVKDNILGYIQPSEYETSDGIQVIRLPYKKIINNTVSRKFRAYPKLYAYIDAFNPDIILFHGAAGWALNTAAKYKKNNPNVKLYVDSHEDKYNSARGFVSRLVLYECFYNRILRKNINQIDKLLYITRDTYNFNRNVYKIDDEKLRFFPLGGIVADEDERLKLRKKIRSELNLQENDILCIHSGKMDSEKRTIEILNGFSAFEGKNVKLLIIGTAEKSIEEEIKRHAKVDDRILYLGWLKSEVLQQYLMASDLYIQLGSQSATMQQALCNGCVVAVYPFESHTFLLKDNAYYIESSKEITQLLEKISINANELNEKQKNSFNFAKKTLDYKVISNQIITGFN
jgi:hypothetical protein